MAIKSSNPIENAKNKAKVEALRKLYLEEGASKQMEDSLYGNKKAKGPLSGKEIRILKSSPEMERLARLICVERAFNDVGNAAVKIATYGVDPKIKQSARNELAQKNAQMDTLFKSRTAIYGDPTKGRAKQEIEQLITKFIQADKSRLRFADTLLKKIDRENPELRKSHIDRFDRPIISAIEEMHDNPDAAKQVIDFGRDVFPMDGSDNIINIDSYAAFTEGPYTYRGLIKMFMTEESREASMNYAKYQDRKVTWEEHERAVSDVDAEKKPLLDKATADLREISNKHRRELPPNLTLGQYNNRVVELRGNQEHRILDYEMLARSIDSKREESQTYAIAQQIDDNIRKADEKLGQMVADFIDTSLIADLEAIKKVTIEPKGKGKEDDDDEPSL